MTKRQLSLEQIRMAAYEGDDARVVRLLVETRINRPDQLRAVALGRRQREAKINEKV